MTSRHALKEVDSSAVQQAESRDETKGPDRRKGQRVVDDPGLSETYVNKVISSSFDGGALVVTLGASRFVPAGTDEGPKQGEQPPIHVTSRLALSPTAAVELVSVLSNLIGAIQHAPPDAQPFASLAKRNGDTRPVVVPTGRRTADGFN
jgi:hypothetical protein